MQVFLWALIVGVVRGVPVKQLSKKYSLLGTE